MNQEIIDKNAQSILDMLNGENSAVVVLSCLSVIDHVCIHKKASATFRKHTAELLDEQSNKIKSSLGLIVIDK